MRWPLFACALLSAAVGSGQQEADLILVNGRVYTLEESPAWAEAVAIAGGKVVFERITSQ